MRDSREGVRSLVHMNCHFGDLFSDVINPNPRIEFSPLNYVSSDHTQMSHIACSDGINHRSYGALLLIVDSYGGGKC